MNWVVKQARPHWNWRWNYCFVQWIAKLFSFNSIKTLIDCVNMWKRQKQPRFHFNKLLCRIKVGLSPSKKILRYLLHWKPFRSFEKCFLCHLKSSFRSRDILVFDTTFWSCRKHGLIRKISVTSKLMTSQPSLQTVTIHILPNISQSKGSQKVKFDQLIEYNKRNIFLRKSCGKWGRETSSRPLFIFWKSLIWGKRKWSVT